MKNIAKLVAALALGAVCVGAIAPRAYAQDDPRDKKITLSLNDADVRDALKMLFKNVGVQYSIAPEVQGTVVVDLKDVPFETALRNILDQVKATWRVDGGIYVIIARETTTIDKGNTTPEKTPTATKPIRRFKIQHGDPYVILILILQQSGFWPYPEYSLLQYGNLFGNNNGNNGNGNGNNNGYGNNNGNGSNGYGSNGSGGYGGSGYGGGSYGGSSGFGSGSFGGSSGGSFGGGYSGGLR
jgi:hypothetical protein